jgi:hypothetical protein
MAIYDIPADMHILDCLVRDSAILIGLITEHPYCADLNVVFVTYHSGYILSVANRLLNRYTIEELEEAIVYMGLKS